MYNLLTALVLLIMAPPAGQNIAVTEDTPLPTIILEARLLAHSRRPPKCGGDYYYQVAKYRVLKVIDGNYDGKEIVVDHPACGGDVFKRIPMGSRVRLSMSVERSISSITNHPGIRIVMGPDDVRHPKLFYVAWAQPKKL
jgi:hypothetical protein